MPFTNNRNFKKSPKLFVRSEGVYFYTEEGKPILDGMSGLWCCNAGHGNRKIIEAIKAQTEKMAFAPSFQTSHMRAFEMAQKMLELLPNTSFNQVFFTMCGSTAVDTAMKISLAYHKARGESSRVRFIGRERGYHGVGFGGISVGGISPNRKAFSSSLLPFVDHLPHTHSLPNMAFSKGMPKWGKHLADTLESIATLHDPSTIAAVIIEPVQGSTGVVIPPEGYLQRIREICDKYGILLIFDEVITGFGRTGASFGAKRFNVEPDMIVCAKGLTNGMIPAGAVISNKKIYDSMMHTANSDGSTIEFFHGYTYS
jgi:beta-alanine--pyruvate transaminase